MTVQTDSPNTVLFQLADTLREFLDTGDREMVEEILTLFQSDTAERLRELNIAISAANRDEVRKQAHTLKGAALQVGALRMSGLFRELEHRAYSAEPAELAELACRAWSCYDETCRFLQEDHWG